MAIHYEPSPTVTYRLREAAKSRSAWRDYSTEEQTIWSREVNDEVTASVTSQRRGYRWELCDAEGNVLERGGAWSAAAAMAAADAAAEHRHG